MDIDQNIYNKSKPFRLLFGNRTEDINPAELKRTPYILFALLDEAVILPVTYCCHDLFSVHELPDKHP